MLRKRSMNMVSDRLGAIEMKKSLQTQQGNLQMTRYVYRGGKKIRQLLVL